MRTGLIILESGARHEELCRLVRELAPQPLLVVRLEPGTPGVVSEYAEVETIRIGFPAASRHAFFQVLEPRAENAASPDAGR